MPANEFEKRVQQTLNELRVKPSEEAWSVIASRVRKDKRRRRGFFWLFTAALLLGGAATWFYLDKIEPSHINVIASGNKLNAPSSEKKSGKNLNQDIDQKQTDATKSAAGQEQPNPQTFSPEYTPRKSGLVNKVEANATHSKAQLKSKNGSASTSPTFGKKKHRAAEQKQNEVPVFADADEKRIKEEESQSPPLSNSDASKPGKTEPAVADNQKKSVAVAPKANPQTSPAVQQESVAAKKPKNEASNRSKWTVSISARAGVSNKEPVIFSEGKSNTAAANYSGGYVPLALVPYGVSNNYYDSLYNKAGFSWGIGFDISRRFNKKMSVTAGIHFNQYQFYSHAGAKLNGSIFVPGNSRSNYYQTGSEEYRNHIGYIQVPVDFIYQLNRSENLPLLLEAGVSVGYLINSNYLSRVQGQNILVQEKSILNKVPFAFQTGLMVSIFNHTRNPISFGPQLQYTISDLLKESQSNSQNLWYFGLKVNMSIWNFGSAQRYTSK